MVWDVEARILLPVAPLGWERLQEQLTILTWWSL